VQGHGTPFGYPSRQSPRGTAAVHRALLIGRSPRDTGLSPGASGGPRRHPLRRASDFFFFFHTEGSLRQPATSGGAAGYRRGRRLGRCSRLLLGRAGRRRTGLAIRALAGGRRSGLRGSRSSQGAYRSRSGGACRPRLTTASDGTRPRLGAFGSRTGLGPAAGGILYLAAGWGLVGDGGLPRPSGRKAAGEKRWRPQGARRRRNRTQSRFWANPAAAAAVDLGADAHRAPGARTAVRASLRCGRHGLLSAEYSYRKYFTRRRIHPGIRACARAVFVERGRARASRSSSSLLWNPPARVACFWLLFSARETTGLLGTCSSRSPRSSGGSGSSTSTCRARAPSGARRPGPREGRRHVPGLPGRSDIGGTS